MKGSFSEEALRAYSELAAEKQGLDFAEGGTYDFTRCVRPDGSIYGTSGKCRKGTETGAKESSAPVAPVPPKSAMTRKDPVASVLRSQKAGGQDRQKNILDARARVKEIQDKIVNGGPHSRREKASLHKQLIQAQRKLAAF